jgi:adenylate kinase
MAAALRVFLCLAALATAECSRRPPFAGRATPARCTTRSTPRAARMSAPPTPAEDAGALFARAAAFLNAETPELLLEAARLYTPAGEAERRANFWSRGMYALTASRAVAVSAAGVELETTAVRQGKAPELSRAIVSWTAAGVATSPSDERALLVALVRLANALGRPRDGAVLLRLAVGRGAGWRLPADWRLNATPHPPAVRHVFYDDVQAALVAALRQRDVPSRLRVTVQPPELNQAMDVYRGATLLELTRELAIWLATEGTLRTGDDAADQPPPGLRGLNVRVCVQGSMGAGVFQGLPLAIAGLRKTLEAMDWQQEAGERYDGLLGPAGDAAQPGERYADATAGGARGRVRFGALEAGVVAADDDVVIVLAPQSMVGVDVIAPLGRLVADAERARAVVVLVNDALADIPGAAGLMQVKGRADRIAFARSFASVYVFRLLFFAGRFAFPIVGALRFSAADAPFWTVYRRLEGAQCEGEPTAPAGASEAYAPVAVFLEAAAEGAVYPPAPTSERLTEMLDPKTNRRA